MESYKQKLERKAQQEYEKIMAGVPEAKIKIENDYREPPREIIKTQKNELCFPIDLEDGRMVEYQGGWSSYQPGYRTSIFIKIKKGGKFRRHPYPFFCLKSPSKIWGTLNGVYNED